MDPARHGAHGPLMADTGNTHVQFTSTMNSTTMYTFSTPTPPSTFLTAVEPAIAAITTIAVITTIAIITAIIMEFNEEHIEAPLKDLTPSPPSPPSPSSWQHQERDNRPQRR
ncbi:hypothetical protein E4U14_008374 [Claviceps sp. LM454 group G7]|nr:hypothetical protein E4U14_008374 [Claviceps sp. LM454 group G7]